MAITDKYDIVIGLEVHVQLNTQSKLFCSCMNRFGCAPNNNTCPVCLGMPGVLPVLNQRALELAVRAAVALDATVAETTKFDRKHYFYPDLPKGYQISQYDEPYCTGGGVWTEVEGNKKFIGLTRIHMEEDAGKLSHSEDSHIQDSIVDLNRAGTPLTEIVSEPDMTSPAEAYAYLTELKQILEFIEVSDCNMQEGSLRCDDNISLKPKGRKEFGTKVEIKNMNSFKGVQAALECEIRRQYRMLEKGETIIQETRLYDVSLNETRSMRSKEHADDYRYFPEPDLPRIEIEHEWVEEIRAALPELPRSLRQRFSEDYSLPLHDVMVLTQERKVAKYFEDCVKLCGQPKESANWICGEVMRELGERKIAIDELPVASDRLAGLIGIIAEGKVNKNIAKEMVFPEMLNSEESAAAIVERLGLKIESNDDLLLEVARDAIAKNPQAIEDIRAGKNKAMGALVGFCMKATQGKASPQQITKILEEELGRL